MNRRKQERHAFSFSYLDVFFLILAGFVLSLGINFANQKDAAVSASTYRIEVSASYDSRVYESAPAEGEALFDENGARIGEVLKTEFYQSEGEDLVLLTCRIQGEMPEPDETIRIETAKSLNVAKILSVSEEVGQ